MQPAVSDPDLLRLGAHLWRGDARADVAVPSVATGFASLDALLPGGGWPRAALTELLVPHPGIGELSLLLPALVRLCREPQWIALASPPHLPYAPALSAAGVDLARLLVIQTSEGADILWAMEQALASSACSAVIGWPAFVNERALRRLQLAAEKGRAIGLFCSSGSATSSSLAALRLQLFAREDRQLGVRVLKVRGAGIGTTLALDVRTVPTASPPPREAPGLLPAHRHA